MRRKTKVRNIEIASIAGQVSDLIGPMGRKEYITAAIIAGLIVLWFTSGDILGIGGAVVLALIALYFFRILEWKDVSAIHWEVVAIYAGACAMAKGLAVSGAMLYLTDVLIGALPDFMCKG